MVATATRRVLRYESAESPAAAAAREGEARLDETFDNPDAPDLWERAPFHR